ncbi:MAG: hypothetical protein IT160_16905 [Bryobacterales bacterium]|nr:hypothetical protein [Bryobacterales bacterium]
MFAGHYGVAFGLKGANRRLPLVYLFLAVQFVDILWALFVLLGIEQVRIVPGLMKGSSLDFVHYPYSHSLFMTFLWAGLAYVLYKRFVGLGRPVVLALAVVSHFFLDALVHRPDLPIWLGPHPMRIGFGLWNLPVIELLLEGLLVAIGLKVYAGATVWRSKAGRIGPWLVGAFLLIVTGTGVLMAPATAPSVIATASLLTNTGMVGIAYWFDRQRG